MRNLNHAITNILIVTILQTLKSHEFVQELISRLHMTAVDCEYNEYNRMLTEEFIYGVDSAVMIEDIIREITALKDTSEVCSVQVLMWTQIVQK